MRTQKPRILIVEDESIVAKNISHCLGRNGYEVVGKISSGKSAIQFCEKSKPDLVLMDIVLKGEIDGIEAAEQIRSRFHIPIVYLTTYTDHKTLDRAKNTQPYGYLVKPFDERDLHTCIETTLFNHHQGEILRERKNWFSSTLDSIGDAIIATDKNERVTFLNPTAQSITGWSLKEAIGKPIGEIFKIINHFTGDGVECPTSQALRQGTQVNLPDNTFLISRDNKKIPIADCGSLIKDRQGEVLGAVLIFQDMSHRQQKEDSSKKAFSEGLEYSHKTLEDILAIASHDLKEPLRKIQIFGDRLRESLGPSMGEKGKDYLDRMQLASLRMQRLLDQMLQLSTVSALPGRFVPTNLEGVIDEILLDLELRLRETRGGVQTIALPILEAEPFQMYQLFQNVISNSLKYHKKGTPPKIVLSSDPLGNGFWEIRVQDNGIGFDEKNMDKIFQPFQRLHSKTEFEGSGIGMAICKKIVCNHGGTITAKSKPGEGSTFIITLPEKQTSQNQKSM
ncbi:MAG: ATP-binding protein [Nitrospinaceae bacterium]